MEAILRIFVRTPGEQMLVGVATPVDRGQDAGARRCPGPRSLTTRALRRGRISQCALALSAALAAFPPSQARAQEDPWLARDKGLHFGVSAALGAAGYGGSAWWVRPRWQRALIGGGFAISIGGAKELHDFRGGDPSWRDFTWDVTGAAVGVGLAYLLDLAITGPER
jgi:putative lipoprotein